MTVDIYIREVDGDREIRVPWLPEKIKCTSGGTTRATYEIVGKGPVEIPTGSGLYGFSWDGIFPGSGLKNATYLQRGSWKAPEKYHNILEDWRKNGTELRLLVTGYPINRDVVLAEYEPAPEGAFGNMPYSVEFVEKRSIVISTKTVEVEKPKAETQRSTPKTTSYTVVKGDSLWKISQKHLGAGSKWKTIYNANKDIIESTAKKRRKGKGSDNGHWIYPGTVLQIPK